MENILKTSRNNLKYAFDKEGVCNTCYVAECVEYGELFITDFFAPSNYNSEQLLEVGNEIALLWGGSCYNVYKDTKHKQMHLTK